MAPNLPTEVLPYSYLQYLLMGYWSKTLSCCPELSFCPTARDPDVPRLVKGHPLMSYGPCSPRPWVA